MPLFGRIPNDQILGGPIRMQRNKASKKTLHTKRLPPRLDIRDFAADTHVTADFLRVREQSNLRPRVIALWFVGGGIGARDERADLT